MKKIILPSIFLLIVLAGSYVFLRKPHLDDKGHNLASLADSTGITGGKKIDHIVFITLDTMRADHYSFMGYPRNTTPFLDKLANDGVVFKNAFTVVSETNPSHTSMFTSLYPFEHKVIGNSPTSTCPSVKTLAEYLSGLQFDTSAFVSAPYLKLFKDRFDNFDTNTGFNPGTDIPAVRSSDKTVDTAISWLDKNSPDKDLFLWVHLFDEHVPYSDSINYQPSADDKLTGDGLIDFWVNDQGARLDFFTGNQKESLKSAMDKYDGEVQFEDAQIQKLFNYMDQKGYNKNSLWVITSDHGEGLGSHDYYGHFERVYNEQLKAPIIFYNPEAKIGKVINGLVENIDIMPTLADLAGFKIDGHFSGKSLMPLITGSSDSVRNYVFSSRGNVSKVGLNQFEAKILPVKSPQDGEFMGRLYSLQDTDYKYIYSPDAEGRNMLFNLKKDPNELNDLINDPGVSAIKDEMENKIKGILNGESVDSTASPASSGSNLEELLRSLGY